MAELPEAIQSLPEDETVCKFCGVSYLIHREVKRLQVRQRYNNFNCLQRNY